MKEIKEKVKLDIKRKKGEGILRIMEFDDHGHYMIYIPSLNLSSYGKDKEEAHEMMSDVVLEDFFENLFEQPEHRIFEFLLELGWKKNPIFSKELSNDIVVDKHGILKNFNLSDETIVTETLVEV